MARRGGLGKGLGALIPSGTTDTAGALQEIEVSSIRPNQHQPRERFDEELLTALTDSIREVGILQPILVRPMGEEFELIAGERRWRAARRLGLNRIPALVRTSSDAASLEEALVENVHRADLNALEEAAAFQQLIEDFSLTHDEVATRVGKSRTAVTNTLRLLQLPPSVQRLVRDGSLPMGHARALLATPDRGLQERLAAVIAREGWSVRAVEEAVKTPEPKAPGAKADANRATNPLRPPALAELEGLLGDQLDTRVHIAMGSKRGKVTIEFSDFEDLERIYKIVSA